MVIKKNTQIVSWYCDEQNTVTHVRDKPGIWNNTINVFRDNNVHEEPNVEENVVVKERPDFEVIKEGPLLNSRGFEIGTFKKRGIAKLQSRLSSTGKSITMFVGELRGAYSVNRYGQLYTVETVEKFEQKVRIYKKNKLQEKANEGELEIDDEIEDEIFDLTGKTKINRCLILSCIRDGKPVIVKRKRNKLAKDGKYIMIVKSIKTIKS